MAILFPVTRVNDTAISLLLTLNMIILGSIARKLSSQSYGPS